MSGESSPMQPIPRDQGNSPQKLQITELEKTSDVVNMISSELDLVMRYAHEAKLVDKNFNPLDDLVIKTENGQKKYFYNHGKATLWSQDIAGTTYYGRSDMEKEKMVLLYELKKLCLKREQEEWAAKLDNGNVSSGDFDIGRSAGLCRREINSDSARYSILQSKPNIEILGDLFNFSFTTFGQQFDNFVKTLSFLNSISKVSDTTACTSFINSSFPEVLPNSESNPDFLFNKLGLVKNYLRTSIDCKGETDIRNSTEFSDLTNTSPVDFLRDLADGLALEVLGGEKQRVETELNRTKQIANEIRKKENEIRQMVTGCDALEEMSIQDENKYTRLIKAQETITKVEYKNGLNRVKEHALDNRLISAIRHCKYDSALEDKDLTDLNHILGKEYSRIGNLEGHISNERSKVNYISEDVIPTQEEECDLRLLIAKNLKTEIIGLNSVVKSSVESERKKQIRIAGTRKHNESGSAHLKLRYDNLFALLEALDKLNENIKLNETARDAVRHEEVGAFKRSIFEKAGGVSKSDVATGLDCHKDCSHMPKDHCLYRKACDSAVDFSLAQIAKHVYDFTSSEAGLFDYLDGYHHSANNGKSSPGRGKGKHADSIRDASKLVFGSYKDVEARIKAREKSHQAIIDRDNAAKVKKEAQRDDHIKLIIDAENILNKSYLELAAAELELHCLGRENNDTHNKIDFLAEKLEDEESQIQTMNSELEEKSEQVGELREDSKEKTEARDEIENDIESEYSQAISLSETRWMYSQLERLLSSGNTESMRQELERLNGKAHSIQKTAAELRTSLNNIGEGMKKCLIKLNKLIQQKNDMIVKRSLLENETEGNIGLQNVEKSCIREGIKLKKRYETKLKEMLKAKVEVVKRGVYERLDYESKGTTSGEATSQSRSDPSEEYGAVPQLYKRRRHRECQNCPSKSVQGCRYFATLDDIIRYFLDGMTSTDHQIFKQIKEANSNGGEHVVTEHMANLKRAIKVTREVIQGFEEGLENCKTEYQSAQNLINRKLGQTRRKLSEKRKLSGLLFIEKLVDDTDAENKQQIKDFLDAGVDIVVIGDKDIYTRTHSKLSADGLIEKLTSSNGLHLSRGELSEELGKLILRRQHVSIESFLLHKSTNKREISKLLALHFGKTYLMKRLEIDAQLRSYSKLKAEKRLIENKVAINRKNQEQLDRLQICVKEFQKQHETYKLMNHKTNLENDGNELGRMKALCMEMVQAVKTESMSSEVLINNLTREITSLKSQPPSIDQTSLDNIKKRILSNRLRICLRSTADVHRDCTNNCNYFERTCVLIADTIDFLKKSNIRSDRLSKEQQQRLTDRFKLSNGTCKDHEKSYHRIAQYITQEYQKAKAKVLAAHARKIRKLEWKKTMIRFRKAECNELLLVELIQKLQKIDELIVIRKDSSPPGKGTENPAQSELNEYNHEKHQEHLKIQTNDLISFLQELNRRLEFCKEDFKDKSKSTIIQSTREVFKDYFELTENGERLFPELISKLKGELKDLHHGSKFKNFIKKRSGRAEGVKYILNKISWNYQQSQNHDNAFGPNKVYKEMLESREQAKKMLKQGSIQTMQNELASLKAQQAEISKQDYTLLRNDLEQIEACIRFVEDVRDITALERRLEEINDTKTNRDDYYSFDLKKKRVCVRLVNEDPVEKSAEIKHIDKIRKRIAEHNLYVLEHKVKKEAQDKRLADKMALENKMNFFEIQRELFWKGICVCGFDTFQNAEQLDKINGFISSIVAVLVQENNLYQKGSVNETSKRVEEWTRKTRLKYNASFKTDEAGFLDENKTRFIIDAINNEFQGDKLYIKEYSIMRNEEVTKYVVSQENRTGIRITLLIHGCKYYSLVARAGIKLYPNNNHVDIGMKITHLLSVLKTEDDLFEYLCHSRLQSVHGVDLANSKKLIQIHKMEKATLAKITTLKDFNVLFCSSLEPNAREKLGISLLAYLMYLEKLESDLKQDQTWESSNRLKAVKGTYMRTLFSVIKREQGRRRESEDLRLVEESRSESILNESIRNSEEASAQLQEQIRNIERDIEQDQYLVDSLLSKKLDTRDEFRKQIDQLSNTLNTLKENLNNVWEKHRELNKEEQTNQTDIQFAQAEIDRLEAEILNTEREIQVKKSEKAAIVIQIRQLKDKSNELKQNHKRLVAEKQWKEKEEAEKRQEIQIAQHGIKLIQNIETLLSNPKLHSRRQELRDLSELNSFREMIDALLNELEKISALPPLMKDINYQQLIDFFRADSEKSGELERNLTNRIRAIIKDSIRTEFDIVQEFINGTPIKRFKVLATNVSYKEIHDKVRASVEKEIQSAAGNTGLCFKSGVLHASDHGTTGIQELDLELKTLVEKRIELFYKSQDVHSKKTAKFKDAANIINELKIDYRDVVTCYVDEIQIIVGRKFILDSAPHYPGIDVTISAVDMECVGENLSLDTSGRDGVNYTQGASNGATKRSNANTPRGDSGYDGYDGDHGGHGGNIAIRVENKIINLGALKSIKANGGNGGEGQLGGNGDEGLKGANGMNGVAPDTSGIGGGQTTFGFGGPGSPGGGGGSPGRTGRPGLAGKAGTISIEHGGYSVTSGEANPGQDAANILDRVTPSGGDGGEPGLYGMDQVKNKDHFFVKTITSYTVIDRAKLIQKYPEYKNKIVESESIASTNNATLVGIVLLCPICFLVGAFWNSKVKYEEMGPESANYRDRDKSHSNKRGRENTERAQLRSDERTSQESKRALANVDNLNGQLNEKKRDVQETSGVAEFEQEIYDLNMEREEMAGEIEKCGQEVSNVESEIANVERATELAKLERDKIMAELTSLRNRETNLTRERRDKIDQVIRAVEKSRLVRDRKGELSLGMSQTLADLGRYNELGGEFCDLKDDLQGIIDAYLEAVRNRLRLRRNQLKALKSELAKEEVEQRRMREGLTHFRRDRLVEDQIEEEMEEEVASEHVQEITTVVDAETHLHQKIKPESHEQLGNESFTFERLKTLLTKPESALVDTEEILKEYVRHYRAGLNTKMSISDLIDIDVCLQGMPQNSYRFIQPSTLKTFNDELRKLNIANKINEFGTIERHLLLEHLQAFCGHLEHDSSATISPDSYAYLTRFITVLDDKLADKLATRVEGNCITFSDKLKEELNQLIRIMQDRRTFYLEKCAINFAGLAHDCELALLDYNRKPSFANLVSLVHKYQAVVEEGKVDKHHLAQSIEGFLSAVLENVRHFAMTKLNDADATEEFILELHGMKVGVQTISRAATSKVITELIEIMLGFYDGVNKMKCGSKKERNKQVRLLQTVAVRLIKYIEENSSYDLKRIVNEYLVSVKNEELEAAEDILEQVEEIEKRSNKMDAGFPSESNENSDKNRQTCLNKTLLTVV